MTSRFGPLAVLTCWMLTACASAPSEPRLTARPVLKPVAIQCRPNLGAEPAYPDTDAALKTAPDIFQRVRLLVAGRLLRIAREQELAAALAGCAGQNPREGDASP